MLVGFGPGGGYDLYARTLGRFLGRHIAGEPAVIVQNMPGAGSLKVVNYLFNAAPRDGTALATFARGIVYEPILGHPDGAQFEAPKFNWIGSIANEVSVCAFNAGRGIATWQDMVTKKTLIGASGTGADSDVFPTVLRNLFALPMRIVTGYPGGAELVLAMERGEIDGRCGWSWTSLIARNRDMLTGKRITVPLQIALRAPRGPRRHSHDHGIAERPPPRRRPQADRIAAGDGAAVRGAARSCAGAHRGAAQGHSTRPCAIPSFSPRCTASASRCGRSTAPPCRT